ncbi:hypothetical protein RRU01S_38_00190 [Agrobacterium rubi TR3 = NBRC 13261]|uniref:Uncharacterized protein n=1 Tax=Agrobacterium rubi TR3 = NBRC 13261 TaxID=1368415 RepID=A0A081D3B9_9HYPH|nr:hypothetical protein [Agrobacterium rubi]MBP1881608.1 hypothetical protein [Agrobacterium rubi]GAK73415.1 hypothetical protein RRU01S_38_00190 [Agrobacterium rubi TR3 = NBRC 13261]
MEKERSGLPNIDWGYKRLVQEWSELSLRLDLSNRDINHRLGYFKQKYIEVRLLYLKKIIDSPAIQKEYDALHDAFLEKRRLEKESQDEIEKKRKEEYWEALRKKVKMEAEEHVRKHQSELLNKKNLRVETNNDIEKKKIESDPVIFIGLEGVVTSLKTRMFQRTFDPDAISLIARLARKTGAKLLLMSPMVQTWPGGAKVLQQNLIAEGWSADLWHSEILLPVSGTAIWQELATWLARRNCDDLSALVIGPDGNRYPGKLSGDVGDFYTFPADGFTQWDYFEILSMLGLSDDDVVPPPTRPASGFQTTPGKWRGRKITGASPVRTTHVQPSFPRPS